MSKGFKKKSVKSLLVILAVVLGVGLPFLLLEGYDASHHTAKAQSANSSLEQRVRRYKSENGENVQSLEQERTKLRCLATQTNIRNLSKRVKQVSKNRETKYKSISANLNKLNTALEDQAYDTIKLQDDIKSLNENLDKYYASIKEYKQTIEDLAKIDCTSDPIAFIAALRTARAQREEIVGHTANIKNDIQNSISPRLEQIKNELSNVVYLEAADAVRKAQN